MTDMPSEAELQAREERVRANAAACRCPSIECPLHGANPPASPEGPDEGLRDQLAQLLLVHLHPPRYGGGTWTFAAHDAADAVLSLVTAERERAWGEGYTSGHSNAMRRMSDEPNAPTTPNPYRGERP